MTNTLNISSVMIFAAGRGTRMGAMTEHCPKPLVKVAGRPLLDYALESTQGIPTRVVNTHYLAEQIETHLVGQDVVVSHERDLLLDTGGGLTKALPLLDSNPVYTLNSDAILRGPNPFDVLQSAWQDHMECLLLCVRMERAIGRKGGGDFTFAEDGQLIRKGDMCYIGAQITRIDGLTEIKEDVFSLNVLWNNAAKRGGLFGVEYPGHWCDVGHPEGIELAEDLLNSHV